MVQPVLIESGSWISKKLFSKDRGKPSKWNKNRKFGQTLLSKLWSDLGIKGFTSIYGSVYMKGGLKLAKGMILV